MKWSRIREFLMRRSLVVGLLTITPMLVMLLALLACVNHPVGDPERSRMDSQFVGVWQTEDAEGTKTLAFIRPYDPRTYLIGAFSYTEKDGQIVPDQQYDFKAWLTPLADKTFITLEPLIWSHFAGITENPPYLVAEIQRVENTLRLRFVDGQAERVREADDARELEAVIREHADEEALYADDRQVFDPMKDLSHIEAVLEAFDPTND